jgi:hypothetical protein
MKQLTILCSADLSARVQEALVKAGAEGFLNVPNASGMKPGAAAPHGRVPRYAAEMFVVPAPDDVARKVVAALQSYAGECREEPCLRILVSTLEAVH